MNKKINRSVFYAAGRLLAAGVAAMTILAGSARGQYVATVLSNGLSGPYGVAVDPNNNVYIADAVSNCVIQYLRSTETASVFAGSPGIAGTNNGAGAAARFNSPEGIVYAPNRSALVVVDQGNQDLRLLTTGGVVTTPALTGASLLEPAGIAVANDGTTLYVANQGAGTICTVTSNNVVSVLASTYTYNGNTFHFNRPAAVAVDNLGNIWATDSGNQVICVISNGVTAYGIAGSYKTQGSADGPASSATFSLPSGLLWDNAKDILVISDTDNDTIRGLYATNGSYVVETLAGLPGVAGYVDGPLSSAEFFAPFGLATDSPDSGYYVADFKNHAVRVLQPAAPPPPPVPVPAPSIGYVTFPIINGTPTATFNPIIQPVTFNNAVTLAIEQLEGGVQTYMSYGPTGSTITPPGPNTYTANVFTADDVGGTSAPDLGVPTSPTLTIEAISMAQGRPSSPIVASSMDFVTANPVIIGNDAADIGFSNSTIGAQMYYVLDTSTNAPTNDGSYGIGPIYSGQTLTLNITTNTILKVRAFTNGFAPSGTVSEPLAVSNFIGNQLTFGFENGNSSSKFLTAAGRYYYAPLTLTLLSGATMYSLQFNLQETNLNAAPQINSSNWQFTSCLMEPATFDGANVLEQIPPFIVTTNQFVSGNFTNDNYMGVSWLEIYPATNLYDTLTQDLITYSEAHDQVFLESSGQVVVGAYAFPIPLNAANGDVYQIQANLPSATTYYPPTTGPVGVFIQAPTNGSLGIGAISALKHVTVTNVSYLVGDAYPFSWFNAGDFGDTNLENDDVIEVFQSAIYQLSTPPSNSDYFDAMDSANGGYDYYDATDTAINNMTVGDGVLDVNDVYVTLKRSLDPDLLWMTRNWANGVETVTSAPGSTYVQGDITSSQSQPLQLAAQSSQSQLGTPRSISIAGSQVISGASQSVSVPISVVAADPIYPIRVLMLNVDVEPLDGSPPLTQAPTFSPSGNLGAPTMTDSQGFNYAAAWLDSTVAGVSGTNLIGTLNVTLPSNVNSNSAYLIHFEHFSASPNGIALFLPTVQDGLITVGNRTGSSWHDGIPDTWRLLWFGTVSNALSAATADPDGDGANNYQEYMAGTNPNDPTSVFKFGGGTMGSGGYTIQWPSVANKHYSIQSSSSLAPGTWTAVATNIVGNGQTMQWTDTSAIGNIRFYRATVQ